MESVNEPRTLQIDKLPDSSSSVLKNCKGFHMLWYAEVNAGQNCNLKHVCLQYTYSTFTAYIEYTYSTFTAHLQYTYSTLTLHLQYIYSTLTHTYSTLTVQYIYSTFTVHLQYIYSALTVHFGWPVITMVYFKGYLCM